MINKYITGYNSGKWRLTLTEHCDLHTTAKSQSFNKSQLLFAFPLLLPLHPTTISLSPNAGWKKEKKKIKTIKDRTPKLSSSAALRRLQFWQSIFYSFGLMENGWNESVVHQEQQDGEAVPQGSSDPFLQNLVLGCACLQAGSWHRFDFLSTW